MLRKIAVLASVGVAVAGTAWAQAKQDFDLVNKTGYTIDQVFVSPSDGDDWEEDVLGQDTLGNGQKVHIRFHRAAKTCKWDIKVVYSDGEDAEWEDFNLCETSKIIIKYDRKTEETSAEYE